MSQVPPNKYMAVVAALKPDLYVAICDEITNDARPKKINQTIVRSAKVCVHVCVCECNNVRIYIRANMIRTV